MANIKTGLDYFPFDVDFFNDDKVEFVSARFGMKGENIIIRLLCRIYRDGYYCRFGEDEALLFAKRVGDGCQHSFVNDVVQELVKRGFFDKDIFDRFKILTSTGIQKRYMLVAGRRKNVTLIRELLLIDESEYDNVNIMNDNVYIIEDNADSLPTRKEVKKVKEGRKGSEEHKPPTQDEKDFAAFNEWIKKKAPTVGQMKQPFTLEEYLELRKDFKPEYVREMLLNMHNYEPLLKNNKSANLTFRKWAKKDNNNDKNGNSSSTGNGQNNTGVRQRDPNISPDYAADVLRRMGVKPSAEEVQ